MENPKNTHQYREKTCSHCGQLDNRMHRRGSKLGIGLSPAVKSLGVANMRLNETLEPRNVASRQATKDGNYASFLYSQNDPFLEFADAENRFSLAYQQTKGTTPDSAERKWVQESSIGEIWTIPISGTSLADIGRMPLPLNEADLARIGKFLRHPTLTLLKPNQSIAQEVALLLSTQAVSRTNFLDKSLNRPLPHRLDEPAQRMASFMDFYLTFLTEPYTSQNIFLSFGLNLAWIGGPLWRAFGYYSPAGLGLSPSSTVKLVAPQLNGLGFGVNKKVKQIFENEARDAFRQDALPTHLHPFLQYDRSTDRKAGLQLMECYTHHKVNKEESSNLLDRIDLYKKSFLRDIKGNNRELRLPLPEHPAIAELIITAQYSQTLMFVLLLRRENAHVTLEVNGSRMYGIPPNLLRENPHAADLIGTDIFPTILEQAKRRHPEVEGERPARIVTAPMFIRQPVLALPLTEDKIGIEDEDIKQARKAIKIDRKRRRWITLASVLAPYLKGQPSLPKPIEPQVRLFTVEHNRAEVRKKLGKYASEKLIEQVMGKTRSFELGHLTVTSLRKGPDLFRARIGKFRVIYRHKGNGVFEIESIGLRDKVYEEN